MTVHIGDPHLFDGERAIFDQALSKAKGYLEFGTGGSTLAAIRCGTESIVAVESDPAWVAGVHSHPEIMPRLADGTLSVLHADIGPVAALGYPEGYPQVSNHRELWPRYLSTAWAEISRRGYAPDLIYVDGRFRVACCLSIVVACKHQMGVGCQPSVMVHDINEDRPHYQEIFRFFDVHQSVNTLRVMHMKPEASVLEAMSLMLEYQFDPK